MEEKKYYIVSRTQMQPHEQSFLLWGKNFKGYTTDENRAGQYTKEEVLEQCCVEFPVVECFRDLYRYIRGEIGTFLIPAAKEELKKIGLRKVTVITFN